MNDQHRLFWGWGWDCGGDALLMVLVSIHVIVCLRVEVGVCFMNDCGRGSISFMEGPHRHHRLFF